MKLNQNTERKVLERIALIANEHAHLESQPHIISLGQRDRTLEGFIFEPATRNLYWQNGTPTIIGKCELPTIKYEGEIMYTHIGATILYGGKK